MPLTTLDPNTALIVVDLQKGIVASPFIHTIEEVVDRSRALARAFRLHGLPVALISVTGTPPGRTEQLARHAGERATDFADLLPELDRQPGDLVAAKRTWGAFASTDLEAQLKTRGVTQVVVTGVATGTGVEATARQAYEAGFNVTLAIDAMTDVRSHAHEYSIAHVFPRLGETGSTDDVLALLAGRA